MSFPVLSHVNSSETLVDESNYTQQHYRRLNPTNIERNGNVVVVVASVPATFCLFWVAGTISFTAQPYQKFFKRGGRASIISLAEDLACCNSHNDNAVNGMAGNSNQDDGEMIFLFSPVFFSCFLMISASGRNHTYE